MMVAPIIKPIRQNPVTNDVEVDYASFTPASITTRRSRTCFSATRRCRAGHQRKKFGFRVPIGEWLKGPCRDFVQEMLVSERSWRE